ncbi:hypothetical protein [Magnetospirillum sp. UT-4]|uniref:hypothetical protein n=1 Tax=Magnetospirillum sp. UT-4 TaxID=2681467 RepID=UPI00137F9558|nr:hypothetical protein [Magnetospirillum sp. UT-4]CAA7620482.1 hypothetical protein MTBUT4_360010 [Magnetospirillum sp. UT-4]
MSEPVNEVAMLEAALEQGLQLRRAGAGDAALEMLDLIVSHFETADHPVAHFAVSRAMLGRAMALVDLDREPDALEALDGLLARIRGFDDQEYRELRILAAYEAAMLLGGQGDHEGAAEGLAFAIAQALGDEPAKVQHILAAAHVKLAVARLNLDDGDGARRALDQVRTRWGGSDDPSLRHWVDEAAKMRDGMAG